MVLIFPFRKDLVLSYPSLLPSSCCTCARLGPLGGVYAGEQAVVGPGRRSEVGRTGWEASLPGDALQPVASNSFSFFPGVYTHWSEA